LKEKFEPEQNPFSDILQLSQEDVEVFEKKFKIKNKKKTSKKTSKKAEVQKSDKPEKTRLDNFMK
jgi:hypothetical protein